MLPDDTYHAHVLRVGPEGKVTRHPAGRFLIKNGNLTHLEDYHGLLGQTIPEGAVDDLTVHKINAPGPDLSVASRREINEGRRLDFAKEHPLHQMLPDPKAVQPERPFQLPKMPAVWHYHRAGHDQPHLLESQDGKFLLDGNPLEDAEVAAILGNVKKRVAKLRYAKPGMPAAVTKMERVFEGLRKGEGMDPQEALAHLDKLHGGDEQAKEALAALRRHVFEDPMNPGIGNKYAYQEFRKKNAPGVWASLDFNDLKHANDMFGHEAGDSLIRAYGHALRSAADPAKTKLFRSGGDEYVLHAPDAETAYDFARKLRGHLDEIPPVQGVYKPSVSIGFGHDFETADRALGHAKTRKWAAPGVRAFQPGQTPHLAHSLLPGSEGPVPLQESEVAPTPPKLEPSAPKAA